jgi:hypothetical protein
MVTHKEMVETREKFYQLARQTYPDVGEPGTVWVLCEVLGWDFEKVKLVCVDGFSKESYRVFELNEDGTRVKVVREGGQVYARSITRKWTKEEKRKLRDWWWLLGF